jgi:hypothetical protein
MRERFALVAVLALAAGLTPLHAPAELANALAQSTAEASAPAPGGTREAAIMVPRGVIVPILVTREVRIGAIGASQEEHKVKFAVDQDVIVDGYVVAKAGDLVEGFYDTQTNQTKRSFETKTSQEVELDIVDAVNFCGDTIHLQFQRTFVGGERSGFLSFGVHEHDAVFAKGSVVVASTDRVEKQICAEPTTATPRPLPGNVIRPDPQLTPHPG